MNDVELVLVLLVVVTALTPLARRLRVPYPILLVFAGAVLALIPAFPDIPLDPNLVFLLFLPPLIYSAAFNTSIRDFRVLLRPILSLAVGLVLTTTVVVAVVLHALLPELGWPAAFAFGAIISPPDAVAAAAVFRGLGLPRRVVTLLEGESLINDATALVTYRAAVAALAVTFSLGATALSFPLVAAGGVAIGLVIGFLAGRLRSLLDDPPVEIALSLLTPFAAYLAAEPLGASGVLAVVAAGVYLGWREPYISRSATRLSGRAVWNMIDFVLNGLVFVLIGLQLSAILHTLAGRSLLALTGIGLLLSVVAIAVRLVWVFLDTSVVAWLTAARVRRRATRRATRHRPHAPRPHWREVFLVGWAGMRGVLSLATALSLPATTPDRDLLIFLAFLVILVTLVGQGLSLPLLIHALGVATDHGAIHQQQLRAGRVALDAATARLDQLAEEWPGHLPLIAAMRAQYAHRASHLGDPGADGLAPDGRAPSAAAEQELVEHHRIRRAVTDAERRAVLDLRERGEIERRGLARDRAEPRPRRAPDGRVGPRRAPPHDSACYEPGGPPGASVGAGSARRGRPTPRPATLGTRPRHSCIRRRGEAAFVGSRFLPPGRPHYHSPATQLIRPKLCGPVRPEQSAAVPRRHASPRLPLVTLNRR